ncbi:cytochrome b/b6 domain-containing protein [Plasticicumulans acidivorans]|uniref:Cytochrome b n=1 Tax=Plasticicumulans acidivorans TaxID=886464 RepID=A0A317MUP1_9GAMM|nr:cytochrome b/b6 domain-containing protein [Plasticicumulans acidivorans]PWV60550.1 cytochrome b [Plasticicumulans acidivorans]
MTPSDEIKVWDPLVRVFHWTLVSAFTLAFFTEDELQDIHVLAGYTVFGLLLVRAVWGFIGPRHARFADFAYPPREVLRYTLAVLRGRAERHLGHNPAGGAMIFALLGMLLLTTTLGLSLYGARGEGPLGTLLGDVSTDTADWLRAAHVFCAWSTVVLVGGHLLGVVWESLLHRENLPRSMVTGRKRAPAAEPAPARGE